MTTIAGVSLTRRLLDRYYLIGLAAVFVWVCVVVFFFWNNPAQQIIAVAVTLPLLGLVLGAFMLRQTLALPAAIEEQLRGIAHGEPAERALKPLTASDAVAVAWNKLLAELHDQELLRGLAAKLAGSLGSVDSERWLSVFNALPEGVAICDEGLAILQANNALAAMLNQASGQQLIHHNLADALSTLVSDQAELTKLQRRSGQFSTDLSLGAQPEAGVLRLSRSVLPGEAFGLNCTLWTVRDVTQQKMADEMRNQFVTTATHELRTPLTNIKAYAELLAQEDNLDLEKQKSFCNVIYSESSRLSRFVDQLLNLSQMDAGALCIARHETDLQKLLAEVISNVQPLATQKQIAFESQLPAKMPKVKLDKDKIAAALVNLLGNAVKYTPEAGQVKLTVEVTDQLHFHIEDTGYGIAPEELPRISQKFFRSEDSRVRNITGSGLGLAFVQEVARLHSGRLNIVSELNKGSRFTLTIPLN